MYSLFIHPKCMRAVLSFRKGRSLFETHRENYWWVINPGILSRKGGSKEPQRWSWSRDFECWFASMFCAYISFCFPRSIILMLPQVYKIKPTWLFTCLKLIKPKPPFSEIVGVLMARKKSLNSTIEHNVSQFFQYFWYDRSPRSLISDHVFLFQDFINNYSLKTWDVRDDWMLIE